jgi:hypothetical protein
MGAVPTAGDYGAVPWSVDREPSRDVRDLHGDVGANDGARERSLIEQGNPRTAEKSNVTDYREGMSGMS